MQVTATYETTLSADLTGDDVTVAINNFLASVPDGTPDAPTVIRFDAGRYHTEGDLANNKRGSLGVIPLTGRHNLVIEGPSPTDPAIFYTTAPAVAYGTSVTLQTSSQRRHFWLKNCTNITIRNLRVEGSNYTDGRQLAVGNPFFWQGSWDSGSQPGFPGYYAPWELEHGFDITDSQNVLMEDCSVDSVWGDGVYIGNSRLTPSDGVTLRRLNLRWTGRQGVGMANCRNVLIDTVTVDHGRRSSIDMEPYNAFGFVTDVEIKNCSLRPLADQFGALGSGDVSRIYIHDNTMYGSGGTLTCRDTGGQTRRTDWRYINNTRVNGYGSSVAAIVMTMTDNITIDGNSLPISPNQSKRTVKFDNCGGALAVTNNNFLSGLYIDSANNSAPITIGGNTPEQTVRIA